MIVSHRVVFSRVAKNMNLVVNSMMLSERKFFKYWRSSFGTSEDVSSVGHQSFEKEKDKKVQESRAWAEEPELIKESKINLVW